MDKVKKFCDHNIILLEMAGDLLTNGQNPPPPFFRVKKMFILDFGNQIIFINCKVGAKSCKYVPPSNIKELIPSPPTPLTSVVPLDQASFLRIIA